ncbi:MAG: NTP transferase domain-containing protein [Ignavibacteria bacterium]|nr:NTP transferase domain-containing protein [Ignavibacteria bacterium]
MSALKSNNAVFVHNVDNPFINQDLLRNLTNNLRSDYVYPVYQDKGGHPILLSTAIAKHIIAASENQDFKDLLSLFQKQIVEVNDPKIIANINTPEAYQFWLGREL